MHLVFLNQYYPPDAAPTGVMLEAVVERLVADGHQVTVICAAGGYAGASSGSDRSVRSVGSFSGPRFVRLRATRFGRGTFLGKLVDYASFYARVKWRLMTLQPAPDRIVALTTPPYLSLLARVFSRLRGADHAHWVMDLYPDVMVAHGMIRQGGLVHRALAALTRLGFGGRRCATVLTLGPDMAQRVGHYAPAGTIAWIPLWATSDRTYGTYRTYESDPSSLRRARGWAEDELIVMYSGNMGLGHRFQEVLAAALALKDEPVRFVFFGGGKRRAEIADFIAAHPECRIELHDYAPASELGAHLKSADIHLASLDPGWTGTMVPSKLQGIFAAARPALFIGSGDSSIGQWIDQSGGGWIVPADNPAALTAAIHAAGDPAERQRRGLAAAGFAARHFDRAINVAAVAGVFARRDE